jgi:hypothetical protein
LHVLRIDQGTQLFGKGHEFFIGKQFRPEGTAVFVTVEFPQMDQLVQVTGVTREIAYQMLVMAASAERWPTLSTV